MHVQPCLASNNMKWVQDWVLQQNKAPSIQCGVLLPICTLRLLHTMLCRVKWRINACVDACAVRLDVAATLELLMHCVLLFARIFQI